MDKREQPALRDGREHAVAVDGLDANAITRPRIGVASRSRPGLVPHELVRECWDASDGSQFLFLDWPRLAAR